MASLNYVILVGNLTRDPQVRKTPSDATVADLGMAINEKYKNKNGEMQEIVTYVDVVAWGRQAEVCQQYLHKGSPVLIEGRLQLDQWESKEGEKRSKLRVRADRIQFLSGPRREGSGAPNGERPAAPPPPAGDEGAPGHDPF
jgi:single-strand DNA-binding protein